MIISITAFQVFPGFRRTKFININFYMFSEIKIQRTKIRKPSRPADRTTVIYYLVTKFLS